MDPTKMLEADHRQVEDLFEEISSAKGDARMPLVQELERSLRAHMELEETVVYPAIEPITGAEAVQEGETEHELTRKGLQQLLDLAPDEPGFGAALDALKGGVVHHVDDEEQETFPKVRREGADQLTAMTPRFIQERQRLGLPTDAAALAASSTKDELLEQASVVDLTGASSMNKQELAEALVQAATGRTTT